jgi:hypothetical protein
MYLTTLSHLTNLGFAGYRKMILCIPKIAGILFQKQ